VLTSEPTAIPQAPRLWRVLSMLLAKDPRRRLNASAASAMLAAIAGVPRAPMESASEALGEPETARVIERNSVPPNGRIDVNGHPSGRPSGPVVEPLEEPSTGTRVRSAVRNRARKRLAVMVTAIVLVVAAGVFLVVRPAGDVAGTPAAASEPTESVPEGFARHSGEGYSIAVPDGWFKDAVSEQDIYWVRNPHNPRTVLVHLEWFSDGPAGGARDVLNEIVRGDRNVPVLSKYKRLKFGDADAPSGMTAAELEVTYHVSDQGELDIHDRLRAFVTSSGRTYIVTVTAQADSRA
jgi:hypothetical protein